MEQKTISINKFLGKALFLPKDSQNFTDKTQHRTQKGHWLGWLITYHKEGAYGRNTNIKRDAKYVYNHAVNPMLLIYLIRAIPIETELLEKAEKAFLTGSSMMQTSGNIRKVVSWEEIYSALWGENKLSKSKFREHKKSFRSKYPEPIRLKDYKQN